MADISNLTPLTHKEAIKALKAGEYLVNGIESYDKAFYHYYCGEILKSDCYEDLLSEGEDIEEDELPQLYRINDGKIGSISMRTWNNDDEEINKLITQLLETGNYPYTLKSYKYDRLRSLLVRTVNDKRYPLSKEMLEGFLARIEKRLEEEDYYKEDGAEYFDTGFNSDGTLYDTNYWDSIFSKNGLPRLVHHMDTFSLLLPEGMDLDDGNAIDIYITRGKYQGKKDCFEIVFDNGTDNPFRLFLHHTQLTVIKPMEKGWKGQLYVYSSWTKLDTFYYFFRNVCYRETDTLPSTLKLPPKKKTKTSKKSKVKKPTTAIKTTKTKKQAVADKTSKTKKAKKPATAKKTTKTTKKKA